MDGLKLTSGIQNQGINISPGISAQLTYAEPILIQGSYFLGSSYKDEYRSNNNILPYIIFSILSVSLLRSLSKRNRCKKVANVTKNTNPNLELVKVQDSKSFRRKLMRSQDYLQLWSPDTAPSLENDFGSPLLEYIRKQPNYEAQFDDITIRLAQASGFCWGVERAISMAKAAQQNFPADTIWVTTEIIHNPTVNRELNDIGLNFIPSLPNGTKDYTVIKRGDIVILPAFGATVEEMALLQRCGARFVDATCPWVSKVWNAVEKHKQNNFTSIIHGKKNHEESVATASFAGKYLVVFDSTEAEYVANYMLNKGSRDEFMKKFAGAMSANFDPDVDLENVGIANQTTMLKGDTALIGRIFEGTMHKKYGVVDGPKHFMAFNTICDATEERQNAMYDLLGFQYQGKKSPDIVPVDFCLVVGGFNSSNTEHLLEIVLAGETKGFQVDNASRIGGASGFENEIIHKPYETPAWRAMNNEGLKVTKDFISSKPMTIGVTSGASTPDIVVEQCLRAILNIKGSLRENSKL